MFGKYKEATKKSDKTTEEIAGTDTSCEISGYSDYYDHISVFYRILSFVFIISFLIYIVMTSFKNAEDFNYENFEYIARNFALTLEEHKDNSVYAIEYNPDPSRSCALFGDGLAVCGSSWLSIYSATGRLTCSESFKYKDPRMASSDKFVLIYNSSDYEYSLYNAFGRVYYEKIDQVIHGGAVSDSGYYALITSSEHYNTAVELYDDTFSLIFRFNKTGFVIDVDINDKFLLITSVTESGDNSYETEIQVFDIITNQVLFTEAVSDNFPVECGILNDGFAVIGNNFASFFDHEGNEDNSFDYHGKPLYDLSLKEDGAVILFKNESLGSEYSSVVLNESGEILYEHRLTEKVYDLEICGEWSYYLMDTALIYTNGNITNEIQVADISEDDTLLAFNDGLVYVCTATKAPLFDLSAD